MIYGLFRGGGRGPKVGIGRDQGGLGGTSVGKDRGKRVKGGGCVHKLLVTVLVWPCPAPDQCSLSFFSH